MAGLTFIDEDTARKLLSLGYEKPEQFGPVRWFDTEMRCTRRGCNSPTYLRVNRIPECMKHAVDTLNCMIVDMQKGGETMSEHESEGQDVGSLSEPADEPAPAEAPAEGDNAPSEPSAPAEDAPAEDSPATEEGEE